MISFYFKGGREDRGCEFLHKSFREYLYAEAVVEMLKDYGLKQSGSLAKRALLEGFPRVRSAPDVQSRTKPDSLSLSAHP
jgi:hypothetical protein